jgi:hypothetical protein
MNGPRSIIDDIQAQLDPIHAAKLKALNLFLEMRENIGEKNARWIFAKWGTPPTQRRLNEIKNHALLDRFDRMQSPSILALAKQLAKENESLPTKDKRAAGGTDVVALEKHIRDVVKKRERGLAARTWHGPITEAQAVRHFGAKKVETS